MPKLLEVCCGTKSISKIFAANGWSCTTVDIDKKFEPDICTDIMDLDLSQFEVGSFTYIHCSPPCQNFSIAHQGVRDLDGADRLAERCFAIISHLGPRWYSVENPATGLLRTRAYVQGIPFNVASYCKYGFPYRKNTIFFNNIENWNPMTCNKDCDAIGLNDSGRIGHLHSAQKGKSRGIRLTDVDYTTIQLYRIPPTLVQSLYNAITDEMG